MEEEWSPDYVDPFLDDEAEPAEVRNAALDLWWDEGGVRPLEDPDELVWLKELGQTFSRLMASRNEDRPTVTAMTLILEV